MSILIFPGISILLTLVSGIWLSRAGKPLNSLLFTLHKLIALAAVVLMAIRISALITNTDSRTNFVILTIVLAASVLALFTSGALMSIGKIDYELPLIAHRIASLLFFLSLAGMVYLFFAANSSSQI